NRWYCNSAAGGVGGAAVCGLAGYVGEAKENIAGEVRKGWGMAGGFTHNKACKSFPGSGWASG
uniref:Enterocin E-760 n=1 Tax=Enterococcus sp. TaxID=35783 RepID=ETC76_ENTSX|nr:RecName: Full=Enterocin E-760; AltName: Full=Bacteriocin E-760 [Enterococcus sp.]